MTVANKLCGKKSHTYLRVQKKKLENLKHNNLFCRKNNWML